MFPKLKFLRLLALLALVWTLESMPGGATPQSDSTPAIRSPWELAIDGDHAVEATFSEARDQHRVHAAQPSEAESEEESRDGASHLAATRAAGEAGPPPAVVAVGRRESGPARVCTRSDRARAPPSAHL